MIRQTVLSMATREPTVVLDTITGPETLDAVRATFLDDGHPSPIDLAAVSMPEELSDHGRGPAIAHRVLDELSYRRDGEGNHWTLVRSRTP
jgi:serine/threonine-protein kinase RsbW